MGFWGIADIFYLLTQSMEDLGMKKHAAFMLKGEKGKKKKRINLGQSLQWLVFKSEVPNSPRVCIHLSPWNTIPIWD